MKTISNQAIKTEQLLKVLKFAKQTIDKNPVVPILEEILFKDGKLIASDLRNYIVYNLGFDFGTFTLPLNELIKVLSALPKNSEVNFCNNPDTYLTSISVIGTKKEFKLKGSHPLDFPAVPEVNNSIGSITKEDITKIKAVLPFVSTDPFRPAMNGVYLNGQITATDGTRLIWFESDSKLKDSFILPTKAAKILTEENYHVFIGQRDDNAYMELRAENFSLITRTIDERFPDYKNAIPVDNPIKLEVSKKEIIETLNLALLAANKFTNRVVLSLNGEFKLSSEDLDFESEFSDSIPSKITGVKELFEIGFNGRFLLEYAEDIKEDKITFEFSKPNRACIINGNRLLMPVMLT